VLALDHGVQRDDGVDPSLGVVVCGVVSTLWRHRHPADRHRGGQLVLVGGEARRRAVVSERVPAGDRSIHLTRSDAMTKLGRTLPPAVALGLPALIASRQIASSQVRPTADPLESDAQRLVHDGDGAEQLYIPTHMTGTVVDLAY